MAKRKTIKSVIKTPAERKIIDDTYTLTYGGGVTINPFAVLKEEIHFTKDVDSETGYDYADGYRPSDAIFMIDRPDIKTIFVLQGEFVAYPYPDPVEGKTVFMYAKNSSGAWLNGAGEVSERPVALAMPTVPVNKDTVLTVPTVTGYVIDTSVNPVDFAGAEVGSWVGNELHVTITDDLNLVLTYGGQEA